MRDLLVWGTAVIFLVVALYTVAVQREVYLLARRIGILEERLLERTRVNDNLLVLRERLRSPATLRDRAVAAGLVAEEDR